MIKVPVLLVAFNRPDTTKKVFDKIRDVKPKKLYFAVDAPRDGHLQDEQNVAKVKQIIEQVDWKCEVKKNYAKKNQGCGPGPKNAISWVFESEDRAIILEDDCVPSLPFFNYCDELLERYKNDTRIWVISGNQFFEDAVNSTHSYFFVRYCASWGWATWKRCWDEMDLHMSKYPLIVEQDLYKAAFRTDKETVFFQNKFGRVYNNQNLKSHIWDDQWGFTVTSNGGLCIIPNKNLVSNIGYSGTHANKKNKYHDRPIDENYKITSHPDFILCDVDYDTYQFKHHWNKKKSIIKRLIMKIQNSKNKKVK